MTLAPGAGTVFGLLYRTPSEWVERVEREPLALLSDHAHCELRAATSAQALIVRNPGRTAFVEPMLALAHEELEHFGLVLCELTSRGGLLAHKAPSPYADALLKRSVASRGDAFLDRLLVAALIEARSLERFQLLATHARDAGLARLYRTLLPSESRHHTLFVDCAERFFGPTRAGQRLAQLRALEAEIAASLPFAVRIHGGLD